MSSQITNTPIPPLLPNPLDSVFEILHCNITIHIEENLEWARIIQSLTLKKIKEGEEFWIITSKGSKERFDFFRAFSSNSFYKCTPIVRADSRICYKIHFDYLRSVNEEFNFVIEYKENISDFISRTARNLISAEHQYNYHYTFSNLCHNLYLEMILDSDNYCFETHNNSKKIYHYSEKNISPLDTLVISVPFKEKYYKNKRFVKGIWSLIFVAIGSLLQVLLDFLIKGGN